MTNLLGPNYKEAISFVFISVYGLCRNQSIYAERWGLIISNALTLYRKARTLEAWPARLMILLRWHVFVSARVFIVLRRWSLCGGDTSAHIFVFTFFGAFIRGDWLLVQQKNVVLMHQDEQWKSQHTKSTIIERIHKNVRAFRPFKYELRARLQSTSRRCCVELSCAKVDIFNLFILVQFFFFRFLISFSWILAI